MIRRVPNLAADVELVYIQLATGPATTACNGLTQG